jgi:selenocysteine lyase/cysteine desulfurase
MVVRPELAMRAEYQGHAFNAGQIGKRLTPAGPDHAQIAALAGIADYLDSVYYHHFRANQPPDRRDQTLHELFRTQEIALMRPLLDYLRGRNDIRILGPDRPEDRAPTIALHHARPGEDLARELATYRIMAGGGDFYAPRVIEAMGVDPAHGVLRLSFLHYTAPAEIDQLIEALDRVL